MRRWARTSMPRPYTHTINETLLVAPIKRFFFLVPPTIIRHSFQRLMLSFSRCSRGRWTFRRKIAFSRSGKNANYFTLPSIDLMHKEFEAPTSFHSNEFQPERRTRKTIVLAFGSSEFFPMFSLAFTPRPYLKQHSKEHRVCIKLNGIERINTSPSFANTQASRHQ